MSMMIGFLLHEVDEEQRLQSHMEDSLYFRFAVRGKKWENKMGQQSIRVITMGFPGPATHYHDDHLL